MSGHQFPRDGRKDRSKKKTLVFFLKAAGKTARIRIKNASHSWRQSLTKWAMQKLESWFGRWIGDTPEASVTLGASHAPYDVPVVYYPRSLVETRVSIRGALNILTV